MTNKLKKVLSVFALAMLVLVLAPTVAVHSAYACDAGDLGCISTGTDATDFAPPSGCDIHQLTSVVSSFPKYCSVGDLSLYVISVLSLLIGLIAVLYTIIGGYMYITSAGNAERSKSGSKILTYALIGLAVALLSYLIVTLIAKTALQTTNQSSVTPIVQNAGSRGSSEPVNFSL